MDERKEKKTIVIHEVKIRKRGTYQGAPVKNDYLKYLVVIRRYVKTKYGLNDSEFELISFLYSEKLFTKAKTEEFAKMFTWDTKRFNKLRKDGWIKEYIKGTRKRDPVFELTNKAKIMMSGVYKILNMEAEFPEHPTNNPMMKNNAGYVDKLMVPIMKTYNKKVQKKQVKREG